MATCYGSWSLSNLRAELRRRRARISGRKADLVERLEAYDRNSNFGAVEVLLPEFHMVLPSSAAFKDLHADTTIPNVNIEHVELYLTSVEKHLDKKAIRLYHNNFVNFIRCCVAEQKYYFKAEVRAEMKANVVYVVDVSISCDSIVLECQCECAAGMGPSAHCKHVACILFGLTDFCQTHLFKTLTTCTQQLQTFHQAKKHLGSPVKAEEIKNSVSDNLDFDPRPPEFRNMLEYGPFFHNSILNAQIFGTAAISHLLPPANPYAINVDHDYFELCPADHFLKSVGLTEMSQEQIQKLEINTRDNPKLWKEERCKRICSSSFGMVCKLTNRADKTALAKKMVSGVEFRSKATTHGKTFEALAVRKYEEMTGNITSKCGLFISESHPYFGSTPDGIVTGSMLLEVKCPYSAKFKDISPQTIPYLYSSDDGSLKLKTTHDYYYQVQGQMFCVGKSAKQVQFVVYTLNDIKVLVIDRDNEFIDTMLEKLKAFYDSYYKSAVLEKFFFRNYGAYFCS